MIVYCATSNPGKLTEFRLAACDAFSIAPLPGLANVPPCEETGSTFLENAIQKALYYGALSPGWLFAEDSGLEVDALGGAPGVYSARFSGLAATDGENNRKLLERMSAEPNRAARYVCVIALVYGGQLVETFQGAVEGEILPEPKGADGFGYDPLFYYPPFGASFAEVSKEQKQSVSHRGRALRQLTDRLKLESA